MLTFVSCACRVASCVVAGSWWWVGRVQVAERGVRSRDSANREKRRADTRARNNTTNTEEEKDHAHKTQDKIQARCSPLMKKVLVGYSLGRLSGVE